VADYANPEALVDTDWLEGHLQDPGIRVVEVDEDTTAYEKGHIPGAKNVPWSKATNEDVIDPGRTKRRSDAR